ncbi:M20/M25/M40 family metallo-hydrolase [Thermomonas sp. HDW16]|uniref:M28 family metallopeptidase n=1 Tax=Thermomonas sp. HDW16 TaxID=2714945 RepID=UPI001409D46C|nr:M20/M25/M40 family metallo-hydrolase [Thermomonas sp. HDW16]QIL19421.1 M20/M25/M40 family metallo-hydrolase [Thermomonas sp. HDW16]
MPHRSRLHAPVFLALVLSLAASVPVAVRSAPAKVSTLEDIQKEFATVPCEDKERLAAVKALYEKAGAPAADIKIEQFDNVENLVLVKPGASAEKIVIGAHYDKVADGCGAVDNWTGQVALTQLYQTLRDIPFKKTLVFVAFGREEKGLVGSRAMTKAIPEEQLPEYCAMINIDSLGMGPPQVADNMSSKPLAKFTGELAKEMEIPFAHASIGRANSDSSSFVAKQIPAVTIHGLNNNWQRVLHSGNDQPAKVNAASVYLGYRLALGMIVRLDQAACNAYR